MTIPTAGTTRSEQKHVQSAQALPGTDGVLPTRQLSGSSQSGRGSAGAPHPSSLLGLHRAGTGRHLVDLGGRTQHSNCANALGPPGELGHQKAVEEGASESHDIWDSVTLPLSPLFRRARAC